jgi:hypothetical protein
MKVLAKVAPLRAMSGDAPEHEGRHRPQLLVEVMEEFVIHQVPADVPVRRLEESVQGDRHHEDDLAHLSTAGGGERRRGRRRIFSVKHSRGPVEQDLIQPIGGPRPTGRVYE